MRARRRSSTATRPGSEAAPDAHREAGRGLHRRVAVDGPEGAQVLDGFEHGPRRRDVDARRGRDESRVERPRRPRHRARDVGQAVERVLTGGQPVERRVALGARELDDRRPRLLVARHPATAHAPLDVVDPPPRDARERASKVGEQVVPLATGPGVAERPEQRDPEGRLGQRDAGVDRDRDADRGKRRLERRTMRRRRRHDYADLVCGRAGPDKLSRLGGDHVGNAAPAAGLEQAHGTGRVGRRRCGRVGKERALEVRESGVVEVLGRRKLLDRSTLRQLLLERAHGGVGRPARLVGQRDRDRRARRDRPQRADLRDRHVLEAVGQHRPIAPRLEP